MPSLPSLPSIPGVETLVDLTRAQVQILQQIPGVLITLNTTLSRLADALAQSQETFASVQRVSDRMNTVMDEIEEPVMMMGPGLRRLAVTLDDPMITAVPDMIRTVRDDIGPQMRQIISMQHNIQQSATQVVGGLADATKALTAVPGLGKLPGLLSPRPSRTPVEDPEPEPAASESAGSASTGTRSKSPSSRTSASRSRTPRSTSSSKSASAKGGDSAESSDDS